MKITVISVGKLKEKYLIQGIAEYQKRLSRFCDLELIEVSDEKAPETLSAAQELQVKQKEGERIKKKLKDDSVIIVLDVKGQKLSSVELAEKLNSYFITGSSHITFIIGGSLGLDPEITAVADFRLSISDMTFPHQLCRLILLEQIYRAFKIINGETYHK